MGWVEGEGSGIDCGGSCKLFVCTYEEQFWSFPMLSFQSLWNECKGVANEFNWRAHRMYIWGFKSSRLGWQRKGKGREGRRVAGGGGMKVR